MRSSLLFAVLILAHPTFAQSKAAVKMETSVRSLLAKGKIYKARTKCDAALVREPLPLFYVLRADANNRIGDHAKAVEDARTGLKGLPASSEALMQLAIAEQGLGLADSAIAHFQHVLGQMPSTEAHYYLALAYQSKHDGPQALSELNSAGAGGVENVQLGARILRAKGECHMMANDTLAAKADFDQAIALTPDDPVIFNSRGWLLYAATGQYAKAVADFDRAIKINPNYSYAFNNRGWCRYKMGQKEKAIADIERALKRKASNPFAYRNLGIIALESGDKPQACVHFRSALENNFTQLFGAEVQGLVDTHCAGLEIKQDPAKMPNAPLDKPLTVPTPRTNAP